MKLGRLPSYILLLISALLLLVFLWWHWKLGMIRYFDVDEFAHLSWTYQMLSGRKPYVDFLFFFPPGFHVFLMPLFSFGGGVTPILAGRMMAFMIFVLLTGATVVLFWLMRRSWAALLAGVFLAFLPMPFDKFLEIRPDTLAVLFAMAGMVFQILAWIPGINRSNWINMRAFWSGVFYGVSLLILPKTLPQVGVAVGVEVLRAIRFSELKKFEFRESFKELWQFLSGLVMPLILFGLWVLTLGNIDQVIYSLTKLPVEANKISATFIMMPDLFFYPNTMFYGESGWSKGVLVNHAIWIIAIFVAAFRLVTPYLTEKSQIPSASWRTKSQTISSHGGSASSNQLLMGTYRNLWKLVELGVWKLDNRSMVWSELLISITFFTHVIFYVMVVPLKHTQYLIPIAVFVAFYAADAVDMFWRKTVEVSKNHANLLPTGIFFLLFTLASIRLIQVFVAVNTPKRAWTNADTIKQLTALYKTIPTTEYILDLTGETLYYKHPYVVCCTPFGQSAPYLTRPLPSLSATLEATKTRYVFEGGVKRTSTLLTEDQAYIAAHYLPYPTIGGLLIRKK